MSQDKKTSAANSDLPSSPLPEKAATSGTNYGRIAAIGCLVLLFLAGVVVFIFYARFNTYMRYGLGNTIERLQRELEQEPALTSQQYQEFKTYLYSLQIFLQKNKINRDTLRRYIIIKNAFQKSLQDGRLSAAEIGNIRSAVFEAGIPISQPQDRVKSEETPSKK